MTHQTFNLSQLSDLDQTTFTALLAEIFEHSPWVAERAWYHRPFTSIDQLHNCMVDVVSQASDAEKLALITAHPELAGKEAQTGMLTPASTQEQSGAGLDQCSPAELSRLHTLNSLYMKKFNIPFIIAVKGRDRYQIMEAMESRLTHSLDVELRNSLSEIAHIARFRLEAMIADKGSRHETSPA